MKHFLSLNDLDQAQFKALLNRAIELKQDVGSEAHYQLFRGKTLAMVFEKSSTRTRVSFEAAMIQCGGGAIFISTADSQLGRGEPIEDFGRVISEMVDGVMIRTFAHETIERLAAHCTIPVINGLTDYLHPCQLLADMQTYQELRGDIQGRTVAWIGDGNNMCHSYMNAAALLDFHLNIACPEGFDPDAELMEQHKDRITLTRSPEEAVQNAAIVTTDVWASMGQEEEQAKREAAFGTTFQVTPQLLDQAADDVLFLHCLPAHRGEEVDDEVMADSRSGIWQQAGNRLHAQKALLDMLWNG